MCKHARLQYFYSKPKQEPILQLTTWHIYCQVVQTMYNKLWDIFVCFCRDIQTCLKQIDGRNAFSMFSEIIQNLPNLLQIK